MNPPRKVLVQISGAPGAGKSTIAALLAKSINGTVINHDLIRSFFLDTGHPFDESAKLAYRLQWTLAVDALRQGRNVIIDSTCNFQETLDEGTALARQYAFEYAYVECRVKDIETLEARLQTRIPMRSQRTGVSAPPPDSSSSQGQDQRALFQRWIDHPVRPANGAIVVDSSLSPESSLVYILEQLAMPAPYPELE